MAIITISEQGGVLGREIAGNVSQRSGFVLVDGGLIGSKLNALQTPDELHKTQSEDGLRDEERLVHLVLRKEIPQHLFKKLIIEHALKSNVIILNLGGEIFFHDFPGALHVKVFSSSVRKESDKSIKKREVNYKKFIKELYGQKRLGGDLYDLQIKVENMDTDFAADLIIRAAEGRGITSKAGLTWRALKKLRANLEKSGSSFHINNELKGFQIPSFAHPSEMDFAGVLDFYRIKWQYEPKSFPIKWDEEGRIIEEFTPDFYLTDSGLYIELTTLRQSLVTKKNRKLKKLKELYPDVNIKVFYRRDYKRLLQRFGIKK